MASSSSVIPSATIIVDTTSTPDMATPTASDATPTPAALTTLSAEQVVGLFQLVLLFFIFFFATAQIPRAIARLNHSKGGFLLQPRKAVRQTKDMIRRSLFLGPASGGVNGMPSPVMIAPPPQRKPTIKRSLLKDAAPNPYDSGESESGHGHTTDMIRSGSQRSQRSQRVGPPSAPIHVPAWTTLFHPLVGWQAKSCYSTGLSWGQVTIYIIYTIMFTIVLFIGTRTSGKDNLRRAGWLTVAQAPLIVALGAKNSIVGLLVGRGYDKLNFIHRWIGKLMFFASFFHVVGYIFLWLRTSVEGKEASAHISAWIAFGGLCLVCILSLPYFRRVVYNVFFHSHWVGFIIYLVAICYHVPNALYWSLGAFFILGLDHICRIVKSYYTTVNLQAIPELRTTRIEIPGLSSGWRAGQHVRLRAVSALMGRLSITEAHPFTISSVAEDQEEGGQGVVLYVKTAGDWTQKLYDAASKYEGVSEKGGRGRGATMKMIIEGPYGGGHAMYSSFTSSFIVVGGSGITYGLSVVEELVRDIEDLRARTRLINLVWIVQDPAALIPLLPTLNSFLERVDSLPTVSLKLSIHYTRAVHPSFNRALHLPQGAILEAGRPNFPKLLESFVNKTDRLSRGRTGLTGVMVGVCGPKALAEDVKLAESTITKTLRKSVGGVELVEETFGW